MKKKNLKTGKRAPKLKCGKPVRFQRLLLQTAQRLYNIAQNTYCEFECVRRHDDWVWKALQPSRQAAWLAIARHVLQNSIGMCNPKPKATHE